jgi:hypothetical protein
MGQNNDKPASGNEAPEVDAGNVKTDINRYLQKKDYGKSIADMLRVLFKGQMKTETEWAEQVKTVINRRAV